MAMLLCNKNCGYDYAFFLKIKNPFDYSDLGGEMVLYPNSLFQNIFGQNSFFDFKKFFKSNF